MLPLLYLHLPPLSLFPPFSHFSLFFIISPPLRSPKNLALIPPTNISLILPSPPSHPLLPSLKVKSECSGSAKLLSSSLQNDHSGHRLQINHPYLGCTIVGPVKLVCQPVIRQSLCRRQERYAELLIHKWTGERHKFVITCVFVCSFWWTKQP